MRPAPSIAVSASASWPRGGKRAAQHLDRSAARARFAALLWRAFPGCRSEREVCETAAVVLEVSRSTVRNYLRQTHDAPLLTVFKVLVIAGFEAVLSDGEGEP
jgi:hypothetical protein